MKILILSCNTGQGHNSAGNAVKEALEARGVLCDMVDALSFTRRRYTSALVSGTYIKMVSKVPHVFGGIYKVGDMISSPKIKSPVYFANALSAAKLGFFIESGGYDGVVMSHVFPAETLTRLKKHKRTRVRTYAVATDYTCTPFWEETNPDYFFIPHEDLAEEFHTKGIPMKKLVPTGIPVSAKYDIKLTKTEARDQLGLPRDAKIFLIMTGSMGFGDVSGIAYRLLERTKNENVRILVMTGRSEKLRCRIEEDFDGDDRVSPVPFTLQVPLYMDACDVLLTKPGGLTTTEAAVKRVPFILTKPIPGCETENAKFFSSHGMSAYVKKFRDIADVAADLSSDESAREKMLDYQERLMPRKAADSIAKFIISDITTNKSTRH